MILRQILLVKYVGIVLHWLWLIILVTIVAGVIAFGISRNQTPIYESSTTLLIDEAPGNNAAADYQSLLLSERRAQTYAQLLSSDKLVSDVMIKVTRRETVPSPTEIDTFKRLYLTVALIKNTQLIKVTVRNPDPQVAANLANELVVSFAQQNQQLQAARYAGSKATLGPQIEQTEANLKQAQDDLDKAKDALTRERAQTTLALYRQSYTGLVQSFETNRLAETQSRSNIVVSEPAVASDIPVSPKISQNTLLGAAVGLLLSIGLVLLFESLNDSVRDVDELKRQTQLPILGEIRHIDPIKGVRERKRPVVVDNPRAAVSETFRQLRTNIEYAAAAHPIRTLLVTSASPGDGKSTIASNLAAAIAQSDRKVIIVDADLRRPTQHRNIDTSNNIGLSSLFIHEDISLDTALQQTLIKGVSLLTAGPVPPNPAELLATAKMRAILEAVSERADFVILDTPPVLPVTDAVALSSRVDGVLLVVNLGKTQNAAVMQTVEQLRRARANIIGIVVNEVARGRIRSYYQNYDKTYYQQDDPKPNVRPATSSR